MLFLFAFSSFANDDWHCPAARLDLVVGGSFTFTMAARHDMQRMGWQMILDRFKNYVESKIKKMATKFSTCLWAEDAKGMAAYYKNVFADFQLISENPMASVFEMAGSRFMSLNNGPQGMTFNEKLSFVLTLDTQDEIDHYWNYFTQEGQPGQCGWLKDKYGVSWQIVPSILGKLMTNPETAPKAAYAFMQMSKFDIAKLEEAVR